MRKMWQITEQERIKRGIKEKKREFLLAAVIILIGLIFTSLNHAFLSASNLTGILSNNAVYGVMAVGMMFVISTGNIDVSVGAQLAAISMVIAKLVMDGRVTSTVLLLLISLGMGLLIGLINGCLVAGLKIPAIIVTLGTVNVIRGVLLLVFSSGWINGLPGWFTMAARWKPFGFHLKITAYIWILVCILAYVLLQKTIMGRRILAVGANPEGARRIGFEPKISYIAAFMIMGLTSGLGAFMYTANIGIAQAVAGNGYEMTLIAAVVIGGTGFSGGKVSVLGTFLGTLLLGVIENGLVIAKVPVYWQELVTGAVILFAIISSVAQVAAWKLRRKEKGAE